MDKIIFSKVFHSSIDDTPDYGHGDTLPIDQQPVQFFNIDPATGRPMSDISAIVRSKGLDQQRLLANLNEFRADYLPEDISDEAALKYMQPRLCQMPSELADYSEFVSNKKLEEARLKKEAEDYEQSVKDFEEFQKSQRVKEKDDSKVD